MKKNTLLRTIIFYFVVLVSNNALGVTNNSYTSIFYQVTPDFTQKVLFVRASYYGNFGSSEVIELPYKWGNKNYLQQIKNIQISDASGKPLSAQKDNYQLNIIIPKQINVIETKYEVHLEEDTTPFDIKSGIITSDLIYIPGHALFAVPANLASENSLQISVAWQRIPQKWQVESSHGSGKVQKFVSNNFDLVHSIFIIGTFRKYEVPIRDKNVRLCLSGDFEFADQEIIQNAKSIIQSQRDFFNDYSFDNYLVMIREPINQDAKMALMGGTALYNSFAMYFSKGITKVQFKTLFAHEHLHNWIGGAIKNSEEELNYWWSEGFTEYYSRVLSAKYNVLSIDAFITEINDILDEYYNSAVLNVTNATIKKEFWENDDIYRQVYLRGFVFALSLNCKIKNHVRGSSTDQILQYFYKNHNTITFSNANFITALKNANIYTKEIAQYFDDTVTKGETIELKDCQCYLPIEKYKNNKSNKLYYKMRPKLSPAEKKQVAKFFNL